MCEKNCECGERTELEEILAKVIGFSVELDSTRIPKSIANKITNSEEIILDESDLGESIQISEFRIEKNKDPESERVVEISKFKSAIESEVEEEDTYLIQTLKAIPEEAREENPELPENGVEYVFQIPFQKGSIKTNGRNGVMIEELLEIAYDRINSLNAKFQCEENEVALHHIIKALNALDNRTKDRIARKVEGIHTK